MMLRASREGMQGWGCQCTQAEVRKMVKIACGNQGNNVNGLALRSSFIRDCCCASQPDYGKLNPLLSHHQYLPKRSCNLETTEDRCHITPEKLQDLFWCTR